MKNVLLFIVFLCCSYYSGLSGQDFPGKLTLYSVEDGLCQSSVYSIIQDNFGYLWISTGNGLNSFDGKNMTCYSPPIGPQSSYNVNRIRRVIGDDIGNLWIGTDEGLFYFNRITNQMEDPFPEIGKIKLGYCYPIFLTKDTIHALLADGSVMSIHIRNREFKTIPTHGDLDWVFALPVKDGGVAGVSTTASLWIFRENSGSLMIQNFDTDNKILNHLTDVKPFGSNKLIILLYNEIILFNLITGELEFPISTPIPLVKGKSVYKTITRLKSGDFWVGTSNQGIFVLDSALTYKHQISGASGQAEDKKQLKNISTIFEDKDGNVWVGTDGYGFGLLKQGNIGFNLINHESSTKGKLSSDLIWSFYEDDENNIWIGTSNEGINKWNRTANTIENFLISNKKTFPTPNDVYSICPVRGDELLIGTACGIWLFDGESHRSFPISRHFNEQTVRRTTSIIPAGNKRFMALIGGWSYFIEEKENSWVFDTVQMPDSVFVNYIYQSKAGKTYGFCNKGIYEITDTELTFNPFIYQSSQMAVKTNSIVELSDGLMCVATDKGMAVMDFKGHIYKIYNTTDGLPNHYLYGILPDSKENLWISSNRGLSQFSPVTGKFINYGISDGLQSLEFNGGATYKNKRGEMFFGGIRGFNYFHPDSLYASESSPAVVVSRIQINDMTFLMDSSVMAKQILNLEYDQNTVTFEFNAIAFTHPDFITYNCFLEGYDKDWVSLGVGSLIRYSKLPPGKYNFFVKAASRQGDWSKTPAKITVVIARPFWMKPWFIILIGAQALTIIAIVIYYLSTIRIRKKLEILEHQRELSLIRRSIASDLHDDVGSGLSKLAMLSDTTISKVKDNPEVVQRLINLSASARKLIDQLRVVVWTLNPQYDQLESLISYIHQQAGDFLDNSPLKATFTLPEKIQSLIVTTEFKRNIHYTIMEALHNAVKHSGAEEIFIEIKINDNQLEICIRDTGIGFNSDEISGFGNGLHFMLKRMGDIKGKLLIESRQGMGTTVKITALL